MDESDDKLKRFTELIDRERSQEAFVFFLNHIENESFQQLSTLGLSMLDVLCQKSLSYLLEHHTLWLVNHPDRLRRMLQLLMDALKVNYRPSSTIDQIAWLRCLLAINQALTGQVDSVHKELCLAGNRQRIDSIPEPNGIFRSQVQSIELTERTSAEFLKGFFASYLEFLKRVGQFELANHLDSRISKLLGHIARDEKRPGVAQVLFYDKASSIGYSGFIHVSIERLPDGEKTKPIQYAGIDKDVIDQTMKKASVYSRDAVDHYLKRTGYPDGLDERLIRWEIATVEGEPVKLQQRFQGGSIALPLAIAIISQYLAKPVANDVAFTGTFTEAAVAEGQIQPVDGIPEKIRHTVASGSKLVYIPVANAQRLNTEPSLQNLVKEHHARIVAAESLDEVCSLLFPPEGSGYLADIIKDTTKNIMQILKPKIYTKKDTLEKPTHLRYRSHIIICSVLTVLLVFLESWRLYKAFAPDFPTFDAWFRNILSVVLVSAGILVSFSLPDACLRHRKIWSWYVGAGTLAVFFAAATVLLGQMLPQFTSISSIYNAPPALGLIKDIFVIWVFAAALACNTFNAVASIENLISRRQFVTARLSLRWDSPFEARMPITCIYFPWLWGLLAIGAVAGHMIGWELRYYGTIDTHTTAGYWEVYLGLSRDIVFLVAIAEVMIFYKIALSRIRKALS